MVQNQSSLVFPQTYTTEDKNANSTSGCQARTKI